MWCSCAVRRMWKMNAHLCHTVGRTSPKSFLWSLCSFLILFQERALSDLEAPFSFQPFHCKKLMADAAAQQFFMIHVGMTNAVGRGPGQSISSAIDEPVAGLWRLDEVSYPIAESDHPESLTPPRRSPSSFR